MASAAAVGRSSWIATVDQPIPGVRARLATSSSSRVSTAVEGLARRANVLQLSAPRTEKNLRLRRLTVTNAATKVKSPAEVDWKTRREYLLKAKVRTVPPKEARRLQQEQGYTIIDVRPEAEYKNGHPAGAINAQVYRLIKDWTLWDISRRVAFAFFGIFQGTEENPDFLNEVNAAVETKDRVIVACIAGGSLRPTPNLAEGSQSRSLIAAYFLAQGGYTNIVHLDGGLKEWFKQDLPTEEEEES